MKTFRNTSIIIFCVAALASCKNQNDAQQIENATAGGIETAMKVPEMKEASKANKASNNSKNISGELFASLDGEPFVKSDWNSSNSRIVFNKDLTVFTLCISPKGCNELIKIKISDSPIPYDKVEPTYYKTGNAGVSENRFFSISYYNEDDRASSFASEEGKVTLIKLSDTQLTATFTGTVQQGNFGKTESKPFIMELKLDYSFITSDKR